MQHSVLSSHLNISVLSAERQNMTKTKRFTQRQRLKYRKAKGQQVGVGEEDRTLLRKGQKERNVSRDRERWIERLIVEERATLQHL